MLYLPTLSLVLAVKTFAHLGQKLTVSDGVPARIRGDSVGSVWHKRHLRRAHLAFIAAHTSYVYFGVKVQMGLANLVLSVAAHVCGHLEGLLLLLFLGFCRNEKPLAWSSSWQSPCHCSSSICKLSILSL